MAIVMDSALNLMLEQLLLQNFTNKDRGVKEFFNIKTNGPLVSLTSKARLAYALNIIDSKIFSDLKIIRDIRNRCAHDCYVSFGDTKICNFIGKLSIIPNGKTVTENNSYEFFMEAIRNCFLRPEKNQKNTE